MYYKLTMRKWSMFSNIFGSKKVKGPYKQIIIIRVDIKMGKGKIAAQASHASVSAYIQTKSKHPSVADEWILSGQKKVVLKVNSEDELIQMFRAAKDQGIPAVLITDAGKTQIPSGTKTALGVGPWSEEILDKLFGDLKLL